MCSGTCYVSQAEVALLGDTGYLPLIQLMALSYTYAAHYSPVSANVSALLSFKFIIAVLLVYFVFPSVFTDGFKPFLFNVGQKLPSSNISISPVLLSRVFRCSWVNPHLL